MKRVLILTLVLILVMGAMPVSADALELVEEDPVLEYGSLWSDTVAVPMELMAQSDVTTYEMAPIPEGGEYVTMYASQEMVDVIKDFEGFSATPYWDNTQWTVGYGTRCDGPDVRVTKEEAEALLREVLEKDYGNTVNKFCKRNGKQPNQQQFDAMLDLTYNVGGSWTTGAAVPDVLLKPSTALEIVRGFGAWSRSGGRVSYVHVNRRIREALIYLYGEYYLAYSNGDSKSDIEVVSDDDLPRFKAVIFKTSEGTLPNGRTDYAGYYAEGAYYGSFLDATRDGYTLVGWEITKRSNEAIQDGGKISIYDKATENLELTAMWQEGVVEVVPDEPPEDYVDPSEPTEPSEPTDPSEPSEPSEPTDPSEPSAPVMPFTDVAENAWFYPAIQYVYENKLMNGIADTQFDPDGSMTRGMLMMVLYRMEGSPEITEDMISGFTDIDGRYYTDAVNWAHHNGIAEGLDDKTFAPERVITRQEAVTFFHRFCVEYLKLASEQRADLTGFADAQIVAGYALEPFAWAVGVELVEGSYTGDVALLDPLGELTRAQAATLLMRCNEQILLP